MVKLGGELGFYDEVVVELMILMLWLLSQQLPDCFVRLGG